MEVVALVHCNTRHRDAAPKTKFQSISVTVSELSLTVANGKVSPPYMTAIIHTIIFPPPPHQNLELFMIEVTFTHLRFPSFPSTYWVQKLITQRQNPSY